MTTATSNTSTFSINASFYTSVREAVISFLVFLGCSVIAYRIVQYYRWRPRPVVDGTERRTGSAPPSVLNVRLDNERHRGGLRRRAATTAGVGNNDDDALADLTEQEAIRIAVRSGGPIRGLGKRLPVGALSRGASRRRGSDPLNLGLNYDADTDDDTANETTAQCASDFLHGTAAAIADSLAHATGQHSKSEESDAERDSEGEDEEDDSLDSLFPQLLCVVALAAALLNLLWLPTTVLLERLMDREHAHYYWQWLNHSLVFTLHQHAIYSANLALYVFLPIAYFYSEAAQGVGVTGSSVAATLREAVTVWFLVATLAAGGVFVAVSMLGASGVDAWMGVLDGWMAVVCSIGSVWAVPRGCLRLFAWLRTLPVRLWHQRRVEEQLTAIGFEEAVWRRRLTAATPKAVPPTTVPTISIESDRQADGATAALTHLRPQRIRHRSVSNPELASAAESNHSGTSWHRHTEALSAAIAKIRQTGWLPAPLSPTLDGYSSSPGSQSPTRVKGTANLHFPSLIASLPRRRADVRNLIEQASNWRPLNRWHGRQRSISDAHLTELSKSPDTLRTLPTLWPSNRNEFGMAPLLPTALSSPALSTSTGSENDASSTSSFSAGPGSPVTSQTVQPSSVAQQAQVLLAQQRLSQLGEERRAAEETLRASPVLRNAGFALLSLIATMSWLLLQVRVALSLIRGLINLAVPMSDSALDSLLLLRWIPVTGAGTLLRTILVVYFCVCMLVGVYSARTMRSIRPRPGRTSIKAAVSNIAVLVILGAGLPVIAVVLGLADTASLADVAGEVYDSAQAAINEFAAEVPAIPQLTWWQWLTSRETWWTALCLIWSWLCTLWYWARPWAASELSTLIDSTTTTTTASTLLSTTPPTPTALAFGERAAALGLPDFGSWGVWLATIYRVSMLVSVSYALLERTVLSSIRV